MASCRDGRSYPGPETGMGRTAPEVAHQRVQDGWVAPLVTGWGTGTGRTAPEVAHQRVQDGWDTPLATWRARTEASRQLRDPTQTPTAHTRPHPDRQGQTTHHETDTPQQTHNHHTRGHQRPRHHPPTRDARLSWSSRPESSPQTAYTACVRWWYRQTYNIPSE